MGGYSPGHPWYYKLRGRPLYPKEIGEHAIASGYRGYDADRIAALDRLAEPKRSQQLRVLRSEIAGEIASDIGRYREVVRELRAEGSEPDCGSSSDLHMSASLKHNHLYNGFARLAFTEELLAKQGDLFG
jgi:hypothetical protein